ncbi:MAG: hypothetical protein CVU50_05235 [Candidatus Cloacimonetes bacterium HGW-Cloacimonetes-3]|jgi:DEAD/DEAH box helicase domain-containing protein|nr:MAG: hypothetical protein CVU50_05235 [Candidatus Cloacimonetes bacterium HGW-Cloacimonetes-3]
MAYMNMDEILSKHKNRIVAIKSIPGRKARLVEVPDELCGSIKTGLKKMGITQLYSHQGRMFSEVSQNRNVIITTGTSSGKSLAFYLPVFQRILNNPLAKALFLYPTKALAQDQKASLEIILKAIGCKREISIGVYDGDTHPSERKRIREYANIILTNPDMINVGFLSNHNKYGFPQLFQNLQFVVLDELHVYRGAFGTHVANLMRRLIRVCLYHGSHPKFLCSSATIANPIELAENICGKPFVLIDEDGSNCAEKRLVLWKSPDPNVHDLIKEVTELIPDLIANDISSITFCRSRRGVEVASKEIRDILLQEYGGHGINNMVSAYRSGLNPDERRVIEKNLRSGTLRSVISTNALELGIDIGSLDAVVMAGFPSTKASFWQQSGRAGRRAEKAYIVLLLSNSPIEHYIANHPEWLTDSNVENAIVDISNIFIQLAHIRAAAHEVPLSQKDFDYFPDLGIIVNKLVETGDIIHNQGVFVWSSNTNPANDISLRNISNESVDVIDMQNDKTITSTDLVTAKFELYPGAIYIHDGAQYKVRKLKLEDKTAELICINSDHYTVPWIESAVDVLSIVNQKPVLRCSAFWGDVSVSTEIIGYKKISFFTHQNIGFEELEESLSEELDTEGIWIILPDNLQDIPTRLGSGDESKNNMNYKYDVDGVVFAFKNAAEIRTMSTYGDIGATLFMASDSKKTALIIYDKYRGGLGFAQKIFELVEEVIRDAIKMVAFCSCKHGCPSCVGNMDIDKGIVLWVLQNLQAESEMPSTMINYTTKVLDLPDRNIPVQLEVNWVVQNWKEFISILKKRDPDIHNFLLSAENVVVSDCELRITIVKSKLLISDYSEDFLANAKKSIREMIIEAIEVIISLVDDPSFALKQSKLDRFLSEKSSKKKMVLFMQDQQVIKPENEIVLAQDDVTDEQNNCIGNSMEYHVIRKQIIADQSNDILFSDVLNISGNDLVNRLRSMSYEKIEEVLDLQIQDKLKLIVRQHRSSKAKCLALELIKDEEFITDAALNNIFADIRKVAITKISDQSTLLKIANNDRCPRIRAMVLPMIEDSKIVEQMAINDMDEEIRHLAVTLIQDPETLVRVASDGRYSDARNMALSKVNNAKTMVTTEQNEIYEVTARIDNQQENEEAKNKHKTDHTTIECKMLSNKYRVAFNEFKEKYKAIESAYINYETKIDIDLFKGSGYIHYLVLSILSKQNQEKFEQNLITLVALIKGNVFPKSLQPSGNQRDEIESLFKSIALGNYSLKAKLAAIRGIRDQMFLQKMFLENFEMIYRQAAVFNLSDMVFLEIISKIDRSKVIRELASVTIKDLEWAAQKETIIGTRLEGILNETALVIIDTETTGVTNSDKICQIALIKVTVSGYESFVDYCNPHVPVNPFAYEVHGLSDEFLENQVDFKNTVACKKLNEFMSEKCIFVFHNAPFDLRFLSYEGVTIKGCIIDTLKLVRQFKCFSDNKLSTSLAFLKDVYDKMKIKQHDALGDAVTTYHLLKWLYCAYPFHVGRIIHEGSNYAAQDNSDNSKPDLAHKNMGKLIPQQIMWK